MVSYKALNTIVKCLPLRKTYSCKFYGGKFSASKRKIHSKRMKFYNREKELACRANVKQQTAA